MDLGTRIRSWRASRGYTQGELAKLAGVSVAAVCLWEGTGKRQNSPSQKHLDKVVKGLGLTLEKFYGKVPKPSKAKRAA